MLQRKSTQHALCSVLAPPIIPTTKKQQKKGRKQVFLRFKNEKHIAEDQGVGYQWAASEHITKGKVGAS